jgi:hypothetical protein
MVLRGYRLTTALLMCLGSLRIIDREYYACRSKVNTTLGGDDLWDIRRTSGEIVKFGNTGDAKEGVERIKRELRERRNLGP